MANKPVSLTSRLSRIEGLLTTRQRREVYATLMEQRDHPTASEIYQRVRKRMSSISLATVYNCLEALVASGIVKQVHFERESSRFCPNLSDHGHFYDEKTGEIIDIPFKKGVLLSDFLDLPEGVEVRHIDITLSGSHSLSNP